MKNLKNELSKYRLFESSNARMLLNRIDLLAEVGENEVTNPFEVTEVYIKQDGRWKLGSLSFARLMTRGDH